MRRRQCDAHRGAGLNPSGDQRCHRKATHRAVDDDGETFYFCGHCVKAFEGGMASVHRMPAQRTAKAGK